MRPEPTRGRAFALSFALHAGGIAGAIATTAYAAPMVAWSGVTVAPSSPLALEPVAAAAPHAVVPPPDVVVEPAPAEPTELREQLPQPLPESAAAFRQRNEAPPEREVRVPPPPDRRWLEPLQRAEPIVEPDPVSAAPATGGLVQPSPLASENEPPSYPAAARRHGIEGTVIVLLEIDAEGAVTAAHVERSSGSSLLDDAALQRLAGWRFHAARRAGVAVPGTFRQEVVFRLTR